jgi:F-type H+-transporting ATPase subunit alpha
MLEFVQSKYPEILKELKEKNDISPELEKKMTGALDAFKGTFQASV